MSASDDTVRDGGIVQRSRIMSDCVTLELVPAEAVRHTRRSVNGMKAAAMETAGAKSTAMETAAAMEAATTVESSTAVEAAATMTAATTCCQGSTGGQSSPCCGSEDRDERE
jgi:hypothetical protein